MKSVVQIARLLSSLGITDAEQTANSIYQIAYYGAKSGIPQEEFVQEAILAHLEDRDISAAMHKLKNSRRLDRHPEVELREEIILSENLFEPASSIEIPDDSNGRMSIILECIGRLDRCKSSKTRRALKNIMDQCSPIFVK